MPNSRKDKIARAIFDHLKALGEGEEGLYIGDGDEDLLSITVDGSLDCKALAAAIDLALTNEITIKLAIKVDDDDSVKAFVGRVSG